jgi:hypothetical protein
MMPCGLVGGCQHFLRVGMADFPEMLVINKITLHDALEKSSLTLI